MNCRAAQQLFSLRLDAGLSYEEQSLLGQHMDRCPHCAEEYRRLEQTVRLVRDLPEIAPPATFVQEILRATRKAGAEPPVAEPTYADFWARLRGRVQAWSLEFTPQFALGALLLGLLVGVGGGVLVFHRPAGAPGVPSMVATREAVPPSTSPSPTAAAATQSPALGVEEIVQQMKQHVEASGPTAEDSTASNLDWGPTRGSGVMGQQVRADGRRVYVIF